MRALVRRTLRKRAVVAGVVVILVAGTGTAVHARTAASSVPQYRTATATLGTVTQTISLSGNLTPTQVTNLDFGASGRVTAVNVQPGQSVTVGEVVATMDPTSLNNAVVQAQAGVDTAQVKLSLDQAGATAASLAQAQGQVNATQVQLNTDRVSLSDTQASNDLASSQAQGQVASAQSLVSADTQALADCVASPPATGCGTDQQSLAKDSAALSTAQAGVASTQLKGLQAEHQAEAQINTAVVQLQNNQASLAAVKAGSTPQQITQDQSQLTVAQDTLATAQTAVAGATLTAPVAGLVGQVGVTVGTTASGSGASGSGASGTSASSSASSSTHSVVILTPGAFAVTGSVSDSQINEVVVGQLARVTPAGSSEALDAKVTAVSPEATITSGVATFAVTATLNDIDLSLRGGVSASIQLVISQVVDVLTVPTSAVSNGSVQIMVNGVPQSRAVTTGASDAQRIQIVSGLNPGDQVEIATITSAIPTLDANSTRGGTRGGLGGAGGAARALGG